MLPELSPLEKENIAKYMLILTYINGGTLLYSQWKKTGKWEKIKNLPDDINLTVMIDEILNYIPNNLIPIFDEINNIFYVGEYESIPNIYRKPEIIFKDREALINALNISHPKEFEEFKSLVIDGSKRSDLPGGPIELSWSDKILTPGYFAAMIGMSFFVLAPLMLPAAGVSAVALGIFTLIRTAALAIGIYQMAVEDSPSNPGLTRFEAFFKKGTDAIKGAGNIVVQELIIPLAIFGGLGFVLYKMATKK